MRNKITFTNKRFIVPKIVMMSIFMFSFVISGNDYDKVLVRSFSTEAASHMIFKTMDEVNVTYWDKDYIRVHTNIKADKIRPQMMSHFVQMDVFDFEVAHQGDTMTVSTFGQEKVVYMNGVEVSWEVDYQVFMPTYITIETKRRASDFIFWAASE